MQLTEYLDYLVEWLKQCVKDANAKGLIVGVSGGVDSAVVAFLAKKACGDNTLGLILPCESNVEDIIDGKAVCNASNLKFLTVDLKDTFQTLKGEILKSSVINYSNPATTLAFSNTKARLRMTTLYAIGQSLGYLVVGTDNLDEWHTGYFTKYGDGGVDLVPIVSLTKGEVWAAAKILGVPQKIIDRRPTAGLVSGVYDEDELKVKYKVIDDYLLGNPVDEFSQKRIEELHRVSEHKRSLAKAPKPIVRK